MENCKLRDILCQQDPHHDFSRNIHPRDLDLFISSLPKITNYLFAFSQPIYAIYTVKVPLQPF